MAPTMSASTSGQSASSRESTPESPSASSSPGNETDDLAKSMKRLTLSPPAQPELVKRVALILNRFSKDVPIIYCTNDDILPRSLALGRPFFDFVTKADEIRIRQAIDMVKSWGVSERGNPADGGFAFNRFHMYLRGRDSWYAAEPLTFDHIAFNVLCVLAADISLSAVPELKAKAHANADPCMRWRPSWDRSL